MTLPTTALQLRSTVQPDATLTVHLESVPVPVPGPDEVLIQVRVQHAVLAEADLDLLAARVGLDVDVGHALRRGIDDHAVDQPHQRVVGLLDLRVVVVACVVLAL